MLNIVKLCFCFQSISTKSLLHLKLKASSVRSKEYILNLRGKNDPSTVNKLQCYLNVITIGHEAVLVTRGLCPLMRHPFCPVSDLLFAHDKNNTKLVINLM